MNTYKCPKCEHILEECEYISTYPDISADGLYCERCDEVYGEDDEVMIEICGIDKLYDKS